jgi:hypothetical protein
MGHSNLLQEVMAERVGQSLPPNCWSVVTRRVRVVVPRVPQVLEQVVQADHPETMQSRGQEFMLQVRSISVGHSSPPWAAAVRTS